MKKYSSMESIQLEGKTKKLIQLRDKISKVNKPRKQEDEIKLQQAYTKIKEDEKTISKLFDAISDHYYKTQNRIVQIIDRAERKIEEIQEHLFHQLDKIKNLQLDSIKEDIENHLKYSRRIKRLMMTGMTKSTKKVAKQFNIGVIIKKVQDMNPSCRKIDREIDNFQKLIQEIIQVRISDLGKEKAIMESKTSKEKYSYLQFLNNSSRKQSTQLHNIKSMTSLVSEFEEFSEYRKQIESQEKDEKSSDFDLLLPTSNKYSEEVEQMSFPSRKELQNKSRAHEDFSINMKKSMEKSKDIKHFGNQQYMDSKDLFGKDSLSGRRNRSINFDDQNSVTGKNSFRSTLVRVKSSQHLRNSGFGLINGEQLIGKNMKSEYSLKLSKSLMHSGLNSKRSNPLESLKQQQLKYNELKKKMRN